MCVFSARDEQMCPQAGICVCVLYIFSHYISRAGSVGMNCCFWGLPGGHPFIYSTVWASAYIFMLPFSFFSILSISLSLFFSNLDFTNTKKSVHKWWTVHHRPHYSISNIKSE